MCSAIGFMLSIKFLGRGFSDYMTRQLLSAVENISDLGSSVVVVLSEHHHELVSDVRQVLFERLSYMRIFILNRHLNHYSSI